MVARLLAALLCFVAGTICATANEDRFAFTTGGMARLPNTQLPSDQGNAIFDGWFKGAFILHSGSRGALALALRVKHVSDTEKYPFNNSTTAGVELSYKAILGKRASLTFKLRHDWSRKRTGTSQEGTRSLVDYFFLDYRVPDTPERMLNMEVKSRVLKVFANLTFPETLTSGDTNVAVFSGINYAVNLKIPKNRLQLAPYVGLNIAWDLKGFSYNNKAQPSVGIKLKHPLPSGDIHLGLRYQGDYRWKTNTFEHGPGAFIGWYRAF